MLLFFAMVCISCICPPKAVIIGGAAPEQAEVMQALSKLTDICTKNAEKLQDLEKHMKHLEQLEQLEQLANIERLIGSHLSVPVAKEPQPASPSQLGAAVPLPPAIKFAAQALDEAANAAVNTNYRACCSRKNYSKASAKECFMSCPRKFKSCMFNNRVTIIALTCGIPFEILGLIAAYQQLRLFFQTFQ